MQIVCSGEVRSAERTHTVIVQQQQERVCDSFALSGPPIGPPVSPNKFHLMVYLMSSTRLMATPLVTIVAL